MLTIYNISRLVTMEPSAGREGALGVIPRGAVVMDGDRISWVGPESELTGEISPATSIDANNGVVMPGLIDCHTHLVHAGWRADEFVKRSRGATYQEIAAGGGGIMSTVRATRAASEDDLLASAVARASEAMSRGVTTIEIKSGYGLDLETELKMLRVVQHLRDQVPINIVSTFLGAHVVPTELRDNRAQYLKIVCEEMIPAVAAESLAQMCDVFVEEGAFTPDEARAIAAAAHKAGMKLRLHVDQFSDVVGGALAAELGALSADHLDAVSDSGIAAMAKGGVVAVLLPGATMFAGKGRVPPVAKLVAGGVPIAIATDYNPGTSPTLDLFLCATLAVTQMGLDPDLALLGITRNAARALGKDDGGSIAVGKSADIVISGCENEYFPLYRFGSSSVRTVICRGEVLTE